MKLTTGLLICVGLCSTLITYGQQLPDTTKSFSIRIKDGSQVRGKISNVQENDLYLNSTTLGDLKISKSQIKNIREVSSGTSQKYINNNPDPSRTMFTPSAISVGKNNLVWHNSYVLFNTFEYGITDFLSIEAGPDLLELMAWGSAAGFAKIKIGQKISPNLHIGGGVFAHISSWDIEYQESAMAVAFGNFTYGNSDANITANVAYGMIDYEVLELPTVSLSGQYRVSEHVMLIGEAIRVPKSEQRCGIGFYPYCTNPYSRFYSSMGTRLISNNLAVDLGVGYYSGYFGSPMGYLGVAYKFSPVKKYEYLYK